MLTSAHSLKCRMSVCCWLALGIILLLALEPHLSINLHKSQLGASLATNRANGTEILLVAEITAL